MTSEYTTAIRMPSDMQGIRWAKRPPMPAVKPKMKDRKVLPDLTRLILAASEQIERAKRKGLIQ